MSLIILLLLKFIEICLSAIIFYHIFLFFFLIFFFILITLFSLKKHFKVLNYNILIVAVIIVFVTILLVYWNLLITNFLLNCFYCIMYYVNSVILFIFQPMLGVFFFNYNFSKRKDDRLRHILINPKLVKKKKYFKFIHKLNPFWKLDYPVPVNTFFLFSGLTLFRVFFSTVNTSNNMQILISPYYYYWYYLLLRIDYTKVYFLLDMYCTLKSDELYIVNIASDYLKNTALTTHTLFNKNSYVPSLSGIYPAYNWTERESSEFFSIFFEGLIDSRRLLTDYLLLDNNLDCYKTIQYSQLSQNITNIELLHWLYIISYLSLISLICLFFLNKNLFSLLILSEVIIIFLYIIGLVLASCANIYFLIGFSFFILILGGLELVLNIILILSF